MSNFKPSSRFPPTRFQPRHAAASVAIAVPPVPFRTIPQPPVARPAVIPAPVLQAPQKLFFALLCIYLLSALANDWTQRAFGSRAYISIIAGFLLPFLLMGSGNPFRAFTMNVGRWGGALLAWMIICTPFSTWRSGTLDMLTSYIPKDYVVFFYISAAAISFGQLKRLMDVLGFGGIIVILSCVFFGSGDGASRFSIPGSNFFDNPNDLAFQLVISIGVFTYWAFSRQWFRRLCGILLVFAAALYQIKTGSRGNFLALVGAVGAIVICLRHRLKAGFVLALLLTISIIPFAVSSEQLNRLTKISVFSQAAVADGDTQSQDIRTGLFWRGIDITMTHPIFGIGPGQFEEFVWGEAKRNGVNVPSLKSHDTYIQVSSEMGIPGIIIYVGFIIASMRVALRIFKLASKDPQHEELANIALCLFVMLTAYSIGAAFHHMAYSRHLPILAGLTIATWFQARQMLPALQPTPDAARLARQPI